MKIQFQNLITPLTEEEFNQLAESIKKDGCRDALIVWNDILLDGHNRLKICVDNNIKYKIKEIQLKDKSEAEIWIIKNQFARRNLSDIDRMELAEKLRNIITEKAKIAMKKGGGSGISGRAISPEPIKTDKKLSEISGIGEKKIRQYRAIKDSITPEQKDKIRKGDLTVNKIYNEFKEKNRKKDIQKKAEDLPKNKFQVIYADPCWQYNNTGFQMSAEKQYPTMSVEQLSNLKIKELADENCIIFLWATNPLLQDALQVMNAWGFEYKTNFVYCKKVHTAGFYIFGQHELLLIGVKGSMLPIGKKPKSIITGNNKIHSKKPQIVYEIIEKMYPNLKYIELFARNKRKNWISWGLETDKYENS